MRAWDVREGALFWSRPVCPEPQSGETLVKVAFSGVCGSDLAKIARSPIPSPGHNWRPGHEVTGWEMGSSSAHLVVIDPLISCEACPRCSEGNIHLCPSMLRLGWDLPGGFAEYVVAPRRNTLPLPEGTDPAQAVLVDALAVAIHGVRCGLPVHQSGDRSLAIIGSGPLALCSAAYAATCGWSVTVFVRDTAKLAAVAERFDATFALLHEVPRNRFYAVVDAASGSDDRPLATALTLVRDGGTVLVQNAYDPGVRLHHDLRDVFRRSISITGSFSYCRRHGDGDLPEALAILARRPPWAGPLVRSQFPLHALPSAVTAMTAEKGPRPIKAVLVPKEAPYT